MPDPRWDADDLHNLDSIQSSNFEVVRMTPAFPGYDKARLIDHIAELRELGIVQIAVHAPAETRAGVVDRISEFGAEIIAAVG